MLAPFRVSKMSPLRSPALAAGEPGSTLLINIPVLSASE